MNNKEIFRMNGQLRYAPTAKCEKCGTRINEKNTTISSVMKMICKDCEEATHE